MAHIPGMQFRHFSEQDWHSDDFGLTPLEQPQSRFGDKLLEI